MPSRTRDGSCRLQLVQAAVAEREFPGLRRVEQIKSDAALGADHFDHALEFNQQARANAGGGVFLICEDFGLETIDGLLDQVAQ